MPHPKSGCRYTRAIKQGLNKLFGNKSSENLDVAQVICSFSHRTFVTHGSYFTWENTFFICERVLSPHWLVGFLTPSRTGFIGNAGMFLYPDFRYKSGIIKKKIFNPFTIPNIKFREKKYTLEAKSKHEPLPHPPIFLHPLTEWY